MPEKHLIRPKPLSCFLQFVDLNSQPNGRSAVSSGPTYYFIPKLATIQSPKVGIANYKGRLRKSVVGELNRAQRESGKGVGSNVSSHNLLKTNRPKLAIFPHQEDYCDTCSKSKAEIRAKQTTLNHLHQSASAEAEEVKRVEDEITALNQNLKRHRQVAEASHKYFVEVTKTCAAT